MLSKLRIGTEKWVAVLGRSTDQPRMEYCEDKNGTIIYIHEVQGHSHGTRISPTLFSLKEIPLNWKEHIPHGQLFQLEINPGEWSMDRWVSLFLLTSQSATSVIKTADDRLDRTSS